MLAALKLAEIGEVTLVSKGDITASNTFYAQGGIAGVLDATDSIEAHIQDTIAAGAGLCHEDVVRTIVQHGKEAIQELIRLGTKFDMESGQLHLTREGGHSRRRIAHAEDATGRAISEALYSNIRSHRNILHLQGYMAVDLITARRLGRFSSGPDRCLGAYILAPDGRVLTFSSAFTILATGGAGKVYLYTSNPHAATGDGVAMAWRAGCPVMNLEFFQFHPTCLFHPDAQTFLLTEALRGEGAHLVDENGRRFCFDYDSRGELAPRDIVARAVDHQIKKSGRDCMYLDARPLGAKKIETHFPNIFKRLLSLGIDMRKEPIPIVPAAHYMCGGVQASVTGQTAIDRLYVIGESACTGFHGANRLASNSLLECIVMAKLCAEAIAHAPARDRIDILPLWDDSGVVPARERVQIKQNWDEVRATMSNYVGIVRSDERLLMAKRRLNLIREEIASYYWHHPIGRDLIELRNLALVADLIVRCALKRKESRGLHYSIDHPEPLAKAEDTVLFPEAF